MSNAIIIHLCGIFKNFHTIQIPCKRKFTHITRDEPIQYLHWGTHEFTSPFSKGRIIQSSLELSLPEVKEVGLLVNCLSHPKNLVQLKCAFNIIYSCNDKLSYKNFYQCWNINNWSKFSLVNITRKWDNKIYFKISCCYSIFSFFL